jgi:hypothetical protein
MAGTGKGTFACGTFACGTFACRTWAGGAPVRLLPLPPTSERVFFPDGGTRGVGGGRPYPGTLPGTVAETPGPDLPAAEVQGPPRPRRRRHRPQRVRVGLRLTVRGTGGFTRASREYAPAAARAALVLAVRSEHGYFGQAAFVRAREDEALVLWGDLLAAEFL